MKVFCEHCIKNKSINFGEILIWQMAHGNYQTNLSRFKSSTAKSTANLVPTKFLPIKYVMYPKLVPIPLNHSNNQSN